jgi:N-acetylneuraminate synthase
MHDYSSFEVEGKTRDIIIQGIERQVRGWGLALPDVEPIVFHFGLNDFFMVGETEYWVANEIDAGYCSKLIFVFDEQTCPYHHHLVKHESFFVVKGTAQMVVDGKPVELNAGERLVIEPKTRHSFTGDGSCLLLETSMPSIPEDSYFEDVRIGNYGVL